MPTRWCLPVTRFYFLSSFLIFVITVVIWVDDKGVLCPFCVAGENGISIAGRMTVLVAHVPVMIMAAIAKPVVMITVPDAVLSPPVSCSCLDDDLTEMAGVGLPPPQEATTPWRLLLSPTSVVLLLFVGRTYVISGLLLFNIITED